MIKCFPQTFCFFIIFITFSIFKGIAAEYVPDGKPEYEERFGYSIKRSIAPFPEKGNNEENRNYAALLAQRAFEASRFSTYPHDHPAGERGVDRLYFIESRKGNHLVVLHEATYVRNESFRLGHCKCLKLANEWELCQKMSWKWVRATLEYIKSNEERDFSLIDWVLEDMPHRIIRTYSNIGDRGVLRFFALYENNEERRKAETLLEHIECYSSSLPEIARHLEYEREDL